MSVLSYLQVDQAYRQGFNEGVSSVPEPEPRVEYVAVPSKCSMHCGAGCFYCERLALQQGHVKLWHFIEALSRLTASINNLLDPSP
jgi:hypothetical protein